MAPRTLIAMVLPVARFLIGVAAAKICLHFDARIVDAVVVAAATPVWLGSLTNELENPDR
ncbi:hypothetical protein SAMN05443248_2969 [Bradyrhizobium erythrophlei]|uniref:Uncharacterized protein n=1 Tax=Bradyrhizobium erythrophlei TaxID=1437360 RepID=A0A1M5NES1_9BRAD|nr:hypothetical protein SAMN05443248_2969 [Bradyrhizobium erythrophlei]